jgi:hypothetical protein
MDEPSFNPTWLNHIKQASCITTLNSMNYKCIHFIATTRKHIKIQIQSYITATTRKHIEIQIQSYITHRKIQVQLVKQSNENGIGFNPKLN